MAVTLYKKQVEMALPVCMLAAMSQSKCFSCFDANGKVIDEVGFAELKRVRELLDRGMVEPIQSLPVRYWKICGNHIDRIHAAGTFDFNGQRADKLAMTTYYFLQELLESEWLVLWEGSPVAEAVTSMLKMVEHAFSEQKLDESAQKQARRVKARYQERGYYV